jgi:hypothetical protein
MTHFHRRVRRSEHHGTCLISVGGFCSGEEEEIIGASVTIVLKHFGKISDAVGGLN